MRALAAALFGLSILSSASIAAAQNITVTNVTRAGDGHGTDHKLDISHADCVAAEEFSFPYSISGSLSAVGTLEVWIGEGSIDCATDEERNGASAQCEQVYANASPKQTDTITLTAQQIATGLLDVDADCTDNTLSPGPRAAKVWFLLVSGAGVDVDSADLTTWSDGEVDLIPPAGPTELDLLQLDSGLAVDFTPSVDTDDIDGYNAYCDPPNDVLATVTAGSGGSTAGTGGAGGGGSGDCTSSTLVAGQPPSSLACGSAQGSTVSEVKVSGLDNGTSYAVAVTAFDAVGNESTLSTLLCGKPQPVDDFFTVYRGDGGQGGGGLCTIAGVDLGAGDLGILAVVIGAAAALVRRRSARARKLARASLPLLGLLLLAWPRAARADSSIPDTNWRQKSRPYEQPVDTQFAFEIRFAPYWAAVDDEPGLTGKPYEDTFGTDARFYFGLEFDWMPLRIPYVGMVGPGFGWGYTWASEPARLQGCTGTTEACASEDTTSLSIMPMHLSVVLRGDELMRRTGVPIVPYAKFGPAVGVWSASKSSGDPSVTVDGKKVDGEGATWGLNLALGGMFALNWLDAASAGRLRETSGIAHVYIFGEWMDSMLNGFGTGGQMYVGTSTFACGFAGDF